MGLFLNRIEVLKTITVLFEVIECATFNYTCKLKKLNHSFVH